MTSDQDSDVNNDHTNVTLPNLEDLGSKGNINKVNDHTNVTLPSLEDLGSKGNINQLNDNKKEKRVNIEEEIAIDREDHKDKINKTNNTDNNSNNNNDSRRKLIVEELKKDDKQLYKSLEDGKIQQRIFNNNNNNNNNNNETTKTTVNEEISEIDLVRLRNWITWKYREILVKQLPNNVIVDRGDYNMKIELIGEPKPNTLWKHSLKELGEIEKQTKELLEAGRVEKSSYENFANSRMTKDDRMVHDYRYINKFIKKLPVPAISTSTALNNVKGKVFSKLDLKRGFHQLPVEETSRKYTTFRSGSEYYQYKVTPFGLKNSPSYFMRWLNSILQDYINDGFVTIYVDDIIVYSEDVEQHKKHLELVMNRLKEHQVYLNIEKCQFATLEVKFLAQAISKDGVKPHKSKVDAILDLPLPSTPKEIKKFLGSVGYFKNYIDHFTEKTKRLHNLSLKMGPIKLSQEDIDEFNRLKEEMVSTKVMRTFKPNKVTAIYCDASDYALGGMITQIDDNDGKEYPVWFESRKLTKEEVNYEITDREYLAIINMLKKYEHLLLDVGDFKVYTDHEACTHFHDQKQLSKRQYRWLELVSRFNMEIVHIKGKDNVIADMLSKNKKLALPFEEDFKERVIRGYEEGDVEWIKTLKLREDVKEIDKLLFIIDNDDNHRLIITTNQVIQEVLNEGHTTLYSGHVGAERLYDRIRKNYYFKNMVDECKKLVQVCEVCQKNSTQIKNESTLTTLRVPSRPFADISMDFVDLPKDKHGFNRALIFVDRLTKIVKIGVCTKNVTSADSAEMLLEKVVKDFGLPDTITCDNDKKFDSEIWKLMLNQLGCKIKLTVPGRPQADGQAENAVKKVINVLRKIVNDKKDNWSECIIQTEISINNSYHKSIKMTPFEALLGYTPRLPSQPLPYVTRMFNDIERVRNIVKDNMIDAQTAMAKSYNKVIKNQDELNVNEWVLVWRKVLNTYQHEDTKEKKKLLAPWCGPVKIIEKINNKNYIVQLNNRKKAKRRVNIEHLKRYWTNDGSLYNTKPGVNINFLTNEIGYEPEKVVGRRVRKFKVAVRIEYLVRWLGFNEDHDTWLPEYQLEEFKELIDKYNQENPADEDQSEEED